MHIPLTRPAGRVLALLLPHTRALHRSHHIHAQAQRSWQAVLTADLSTKGASWALSLLVLLWQLCLFTPCRAMPAKYHLNSPGNWSWESESVLCCHYYGFRETKRTGLTKGRSWERRRSSREGRKKRREAKRKEKTQFSVCLLANARSCLQTMHSLTPTERSNHWGLFLCCHTRRSCYCTHSSLGL